MIDSWQKLYTKTQSLIKYLIHGKFLCALTQFFLQTQNLKIISLLG